jgi:hypothetical protein
VARDDVLPVASEKALPEQSDNRNSKQRPFLVKTSLRYADVEIPRSAASMACPSDPRWTLIT